MLRHSTELRTLEPRDSLNVLASRYKTAIKLETFPILCCRLDGLSYGDYFKKNIRNL